MIEEIAEMPPLEGMMKLTKDLKDSARLLGKSEARFLVDFYYTIQDNRIRSDAQVRAHSESREPNKLLDWCADNFRTFENAIKSALNVFTKEYTVGLWCQSICGIGPVITAGLLSHIDITKAPTYGHIWRFAGLDSTVKWEKKTKRPWNAQLKTLCAFKLGESFVKVQNRESDYYGQLYARRKIREMEGNLALKFKDQADAQLATKNIGKTTDCFKALSVGMLPQAQIHARARRYAVKLFLAHLHHVMFEDYYGKRPMCPYPFEKLDHDKAHYLPPPNWPSEEVGKSLNEMTA